MIDKKRTNLTTIFEAMVDGVYIVDDDFNMEYMNNVMVKNFGRGIGKKCYQIIYGTDAVCPWCRAKEVFAGKTIRWEHYIPNLDQIYDFIELPLKNSDGTISKLSIYRDIALRVKSEEKIRISEKDYKRLFENVRSGLYVSTKEGKFLNANKALLDMLGYESKEEFLKINIATDLYLNPEDRRRWQEMIERDGYVKDYEVDFKRKDGKAISVLHTAHVRYDQHGKVIGYEGMNVDQSQRKKMEKELREAYDFLDKTIKSSPNAIMATDMKGNIIIWNRGAEETLGYRAEEVVGKMNISKIYPEGTAKEVMRMMRSPEYGGVGKCRSYPMVHVRRDGGIVEGLLSAGIIYDSQGKEIASVGIFVDLKERLDMERKLIETQEKLLHSERLAAMGRLTSQIAHELNNPLYGIMNTLELLKTEVSPQSKRRKVLDMALSETVRLTELLRKMLSFSKPDEEERQPTDINTLLDEILLLVGKQLRENSIRLSSSFADGLGEVYASRNQLRQVFLNMINNARDAMPDGGTLTVKTLAKGDNIYIEITDTGIGIREENIDKIFDAFFTTKDSIKDVGLGLSVCYGFIKEHGGDIRVSSKWGSGTAFTITLPIHKEGVHEKINSH
ncbi:MAG: PAS domain S-box protein [Deltaproteobacteria bacterium]|nr:MAG: PAS domain S-box protein [Deltaproteobacteria bacterium]